MMSEVPAKPPLRRSNGLIAGVAVGVIAAAAAIYLISDRGRKEEAPATPTLTAPAGKVTKQLATGSLTAFIVRPERLPAPDLKFTTASGAAKSLNDWRGRVVLVNLWATWCAPCRKEMPSLSALERQMGSKDFEVIAISLDRKGAAAAQSYLKETGATDLALFLDPSAATLDQLQAIGLPASVLIDRRGNEIGRMLGPAEWSSPEAIALVKTALAEASS
jgi:thiol-disulfide isomerase/thioredoxin